MNSSVFETSKAYSEFLDANDPLGKFRSKFLIPHRDGFVQTYFLGNSLGLQPLSASAEIVKVLDQWQQFGVEGFFHGAEPWMQYHDKLAKPLADIVGAKPTEVVVMNQLSVNLHLMMISFYKPTGSRNKIICESKAFPSDQYILETHLRSLGLDPDEIIIEVAPREGEQIIRAEDIDAMINRYKDELALVLWGGINYYTGQLFDMKSITASAKKAGAKVGFDLAHAAGNVPLKLHEWDVDFACWCSYKYLNSGPGAVGGVFIHERYHQDPSIERFGGWWGYDKATRFKMAKGFKPVNTAEGWQLSTPSILLYATHHASLQIFAEAGVSEIWKKSELLSSYLIFLLNKLVTDRFGELVELITPQSPAGHGSQVSMFIRNDGRKVFDELAAAGFFADWREPDVIRIAPVPLYNTYSEIYQFCVELADILNRQIARV
ncbi:MAG: kynureninase [Chitinophagaceae bacterium]|nr:MAG: kynureninase [Chitinophagaceae bacterium]